MQYVQVTLEFEVRDEDDMATAIGLANEVRKRVTDAAPGRVLAGLPCKVVHIYLGNKKP